MFYHKFDLSDTNKGKPKCVRTSQLCKESVKLGQLAFLAASPPTTCLSASMAAVL